MRRLSMLPLLMLSLLCSGGTGGARAAAPDADSCWANWSAAAPIVHREALRPAKELRSLGEKHGQVLNITLCAEQGRFVDRLLILGAAGKVENITLDARDGRDVRDNAIGNHADARR